MSVTSCDDKGISHLPFLQKTSEKYRGSHRKLVCVASGQSTKCHRLEWAKEVECRVRWPIQCREAAEVPCAFFARLLSIQNDFKTGSHKHLKVCSFLKIKGCGSTPLWLFPASGLYWVFLLSLGILRVCLRNHPGSVIKGRALRSALQTRQHWEPCCFRPHLL